MSRLFLFIILITFSCTQRQSDATIVTILEISNAFEKNNKHLINSIERRVDGFKRRIGAKTEYYPLTEGAEEIKEITMEFANYLDRIDRQLCQTYAQSGQTNFDSLSVVLLKDNHLGARFMNRIEKGSNQTIQQNIIDSTLATQGKMMAVLTGLKNRRDMGITIEEFEAWRAGAFIFAIDTIESNGKTRLLNALEGKSIADCHAAITLLKNEVLNCSFFTVSYLTSKVSGSCSFSRPQVVSLPSKHHFEDGSTFESEVFVGIPMEYWDFKMKVDGVAIPVEDGVGIYKTILPLSGGLVYKAEVSMFNPSTKKREKISGTFYYD